MNIRWDKNKKKKSGRQGLPKYVLSTKISWMFRIFEPWSRRCLAAVKKHVCCMLKWAKKDKLVVQHFSENQWSCQKYYENFDRWYWEPQRSDIGISLSSQSYLETDSNQYVGDKYLLLLLLHSAGGFEEVIHCDAWNSPVGAPGLEENKTSKWSVKTLYYCLFYTFKVRFPF